MLGRFTAAGHGGNRGAGRLGIDLDAGKPVVLRQTLGAATGKWLDAEARRLAGAEAAARRNRRRGEARAAGSGKNSRSIRRGLRRSANDHSANQLAVNTVILATMNDNPLTDPTSLIAYRLAHGETSRHVKRPTRDAPRRTRFGFVAIAGLGLLLAIVFVLAHV